MFAHIYSPDDVAKKVVSKLREIFKESFCLLVSRFDILLVH